MKENKMFKLIQCAKNTYYLKCFANTGVYYLGNGEVILIDSCDHKKSYTDLDTQLEERGWRVKFIINTHAHVDHIFGDRFFKEKYGCEVYSSRVESHLTDISDVEGRIYFNAVPINRQNNYFLKPVSTFSRPLCETTLPQGFETVPLPGHTFGMIGVKTPDNVWFLGDAVLSKETFESYKLPFFFSINESIKTQRMLTELKGDLFVPAHADICENIAPLALYNADCLEKLKDYFLSISGGKTVEEIFALCCEQLDLKFGMDQFGKLIFTVKCFLQALIDDGKLTADICNYRLIYRVIK